MGNFFSGIFQDIGRDLDCHTKRNYVKVGPADPSAKIAQLCIGVDRSHSIGRDFDRRR
jgi:hypothetical protein